MPYAIAVVIILILDQGLKYWTSMNIVLDTGQIELIPGILSLTNVHNKGGAFSLLDGVSWARWLFIGVAIVASLVIIYLLAKDQIYGKFGRWSAAFILAGALGNCIDRVINGYVVDMLRVDFINFAIFNIADCFVTVGVVLFCLYIIFNKEEPAAKPKKAAVDSPANRKRTAQKRSDLSHHTANIETIAKPRVNSKDLPKGNIASIARPSAGANPPLKRQLRQVEDSGESAKPQSASTKSPPAKKPAARPPAKPSSSASVAPKQPERRRDIDIEAPEFTLEDILAEFADD